LQGRCHAAAARPAPTSSSFCQSYVTHHARSRPLRPVPHRLPPRRRRPHGSLQLALRPKKRGTFLLRIEDTDKARSTDEHTQVILDGLKWLGSTGTSSRSSRARAIGRHQEMAGKLLKEDKAYVDEGTIRLRVPPGEIAWTTRSTAASVSRAKTSRIS